MKDHGVTIAILGLVGAILCAGAIGSFSWVGVPLPISGMLLVIMVVAGKPLIGVPIAAALLAACYFGWLRPVARAQATFTWRTWVGVATFATLSAAWYWLGWSYGMQYQGRIYTLGNACISTSLILVVAACGWLGGSLSNSALSAAGRWVAVLWAGTYAFPWLGELP